MSADLVTYLLRLADDNLILGQRLGALVSRMPDLEEDIAVANVGLDHIGQARHLLAYAAEVEGAGRNEDDLAMLRDERAFLNSVLVEQPDIDFAHTMARQLFVDAYQVPLYRALSSSTDATLAGIAQKASKEADYHLRRSATWVVRLGDGTEESHRRMQAAVTEMWKYVDDLFWTDHVEASLQSTGVAPDLGPIRAQFNATIAEVLADATVQLPDDPYQRIGGRTGFHTEHLGHLLPEMQSLYRAHQGAEW
ncbi:MAG: 1,2-phenylacetyl-CoA epoxidase subunit PaaC [Acidimicrobiales bacterium]